MAALPLTVSSLDRCLGRGGCSKLSGLASIDLAGAIDIKWLARA